MKKYNTSELCLIWLDSQKSLTYNNKQLLFGLLNGKSDLKSLIAKNSDKIAGEVGVSGYASLLEVANGQYLSAVLNELEKRDIEAITIASANYPESLKNIQNPPLVLYAKGNTALLSDSIFGIVGSRKSLPIALSTAERYSKELSSAGLTIVTGIAEGVDQTVLESALSCGGKVISVAAGGFDCIYPSSNRNLFDEVAKVGLVISEYPPTITSQPYYFPLRNRIIAGLSRGVLIVSGAKKSGTLYTAEYAEEFGRDLFAVPYGVGVPSGAGCNDLIKRGAFLTDEPADILEYYGLNEKEEEKASVSIKFTDEERAIVSALADGSLHVEQICQKIGKRVFELSPLIAVLEIKGIVVKTGVNVYGLARNDLEE